ncbi:GyrI-like domain-containing protein [Dokdonia sp. Asnod1-B02]|uniref:GyrI-like domain-containing protein n=1 Tax=Dokdonia sp. Asnod1-B02 TaxID=3160573 RepID=UPI003863402F
MKKIIAVLFIALIAAAGWYFFLKPGDFTARIKAKTTLGTIEQSIKNWKDGALITDVKLGEENIQITQEFTRQDSTHIYKWHVAKIHDSLSEITVHVTDPIHSLSNRLQGVFKTTDFKKSATATVLEFNELLQDHLDRITVTIIGEEELPAKFYAYTTLEGLQILKAGGMMRDINHLQGTMASYNIALDGRPFVQITDWNRDTDSIKYHFAFPIIERDSLPEVKDIKYGSRPATRAIKAIYNGNYITSDRAWYALLNYAKSNNINVDPKPTEVFYNNPNMGGDESNWKTEIYMPIKN